MSKESYGKVAVIEDLYGNLWDIIEPGAPNKTHIRLTKMRPDK